MCVCVALKFRSDEKKQRRLCFIFLYEKQLPVRNVIERDGEITLDSTDLVVLDDGKRIQIEKHLLKVIDCIRVLIFW